MSLDEPSFLRWYTDEISRYRDHEWQLASYSIAVSTAILLFVKRSDTAQIVPRWIAATVLSVFVLALLGAAAYTHWRLNEYRQKRDALLHNENHRTQRGRLFAGWFDAVYLIGFLILPLAFGVGAFWVIMF